MKSCFGMIITFSGVKDPELEVQIELAGGKITDDIKQANCLIVKKYGNRITKKHQEAKDLGGVVVIDYIDFLMRNYICKKPNAKQIK
jgi:hypothetical protein